MKTVLQRIALLAGALAVCGVTAETATAQGYYYGRTSYYRPGYVLPGFSVPSYPGSGLAGGPTDTFYGAAVAPSFQTVYGYQGYGGYPGYGTYVSGYRNMGYGPTIRYYSGSAYNYGPGFGAGGYGVSPYSPGLGMGITIGSGYAPALVPGGFGCRQW